MANRTCDTCVFRHVDWSNEPCADCIEDDRLPKHTPVTAITAKLPGAKSDEGKLKLSDVPPEIVEAVAKIRAYGNAKYADPDNWKRVDPEKFHDALLRHVLASWVDWKKVDPESGMPHLYHICCNAAFLCAFLKEEQE